MEISTNIPQQYTGDQVVYRPNGNQWSFQSMLMCAIKKLVAKEIAEWEVKEFKRESTKPKARMMIETENKEVEQWKYGWARY